jgi:hypothetical protein
MKISEIASLLNAWIWCGEDMLDREVRAGCACDIDEATCWPTAKIKAVLLTGLLNPQVVRTAR